MKRTILILAVWAGCCCAMAQDGSDNPGSLYPKHFVSPILDRIAHRVGDLVTIVISENSVANFAATTSTAKTGATNVGQINVPLLKGLFGGLGTNSSSTTSGTGATNQTANMTATMTATVKQVMPNGNLVIEGVRWVHVNKEIQSFKLTGVVRADDVAADNTVQSASIADAQITMDAKGQIADRQRKGILTRLLDWMF